MRLALLALLLIAAPTAGMPLQEDGGGACEGADAVEFRPGWSVEPLLAINESGSVVSSDPDSSPADPDAIVFGVRGTFWVDGNGTTSGQSPLVWVTTAGCAFGPPSYPAYDRVNGSWNDPSRPLTFTRITVEYPSPTSAVVYWTTSWPSVGQVAWGPMYDSPSAVVESDVAFERAHEATLTSLTPGGHYSFSILAYDQQGRTVRSDDTAFHVPLSPRQAATEVTSIAICATATVGAAFALWRKNR